MVTTVMGTSAGVINAKGDVDYFSLSLQAHTLYQIGASSPNLGLWVLDANGNYLNQLDAYAGVGGLAFMPTTSGAYFLSVGGYAVAAGQAYTLSLATVDDDWRNNVSTTGVLTVGGAATTGQLEAGGDHDWLRVDMSANQLYAFSVNASWYSALSAITGLVMHDAHGAVVPRLEAFSYGENMAFMPTVAGTYYLDVSNPEGTPGSYSIEVYAVADDYRSNTSTTGSLAVGQLVNGVINAYGDHDWFQVNLTANTLYEFVTDDFDGKSLVVLNDQGLPLVSLDALVGAAGGAASSFMPETSGIYYLDVSVYASQSPNYTLGLNVVEDDYHNNPTTTGQVVAGGAAVSGVLNTVDDLDWFGAELAANTLYTFGVTEQGAPFYSYPFYVSVHDAAGEMTEQFGSLSSGGGLAFMTDTAGTYYFSVNQFTTYSVTPTTYSVALDTVLDDYRNNPTTAGVLVVGGSNSGVINATGDTDWFRVELSANQLYALNDSADGVDFISIFDAQGQAVEQDDAYGPGVGLAFMPRQAGTYYVEVGAWSEGVSNYTLNLAVVPDDYASHTGTVGVLGEGGEPPVTPHPVQGTSAGDHLSSTPNDDAMDGGEGVDEALFSGAAGQYSFGRANGQWVVRDNTPGRDGQDSLVNVERLVFTDMTLNLTVAALAEGFTTEAEVAALNRITELYVAFFNRVPDADGLAYWLGAYQGGTTLDAIAESFYNAGVFYAEQTGYTANMTNEAFVVEVYQNVLARTVDGTDEGVMFWTSALANGSKSRADLVSEILDVAHSATFSNPENAFHWVQQLLDNKLAVAKQVALDWGVNYNSSEDSITKGMAIAAAVTPEGTQAAIDLVGINPDQFGLI